MDMMKRSGLILLALITTGCASSSSSQGPLTYRHPAGGQPRDCSEEGRAIEEALGGPRARREMNIAMFGFWSRSMSPNGRAECAADARAEGYQCVEGCK
jgi:hypothetical protein